MNLENDAQHLLDQSAESNQASQKKLKITYARDFLLSLSGLDICKKLPRGLDQSILSEFEESSQERPRIGAFSLRRNEYGSSPPTRGDMGNFSRGIQGRWDSRSSGRSDRDSESQSEWDSDSGKRYGNQPRRSWQDPEHDGLLGSGSFPRPSGYAPGASVPKPRANDQQKLNRGNEPYQPPRPFKAASHSRRDTDSLNDETFGSSEHDADDRAEEERKRRASFELMRKEQQKLFQEKQKLNLDKPKDVFDTLAEDSKDEKILLDRSNISNDPMIQSASNNDSGKSSFSSQIPASRPRVPPGFAKNFGAKSLINPFTEEAPNPELQDVQLFVKGNQAVGGASDILEGKLPVDHSALSKISYENSIISVAANIKNVNVSTTSYDSNKAAGMSSQLHKAFNLSEAFEAPERREAMKIDAVNATGNKVLAKSNPDHSGSILEKLFGNVLPLNDGGPFTEPTSNKAEEVQSPRLVQSSKFAHWFPEEEKKPVENLLSGSPNGLLSLIVGEKGGSQVCDETATEHIPPNFMLEISGFADGHLTSDSVPTSIGNSEQLLNINKLDVVPAVLTCEDLEQSILSEISENTATSPQDVLVIGSPDVKTEQPKVTDNSASQHLLSLLQKGPGPQSIVPSTKLDNRSADVICNAEVASVGSREATIEKAPNSGNSLTLETLFGTAFMKELQSVGAPVSIQRGSVGSARTNVSEPHGISFSTKEDGLHSSAVEIGPNRNIVEDSLLTGNQRRMTKSDRSGEQWLGFDDPRTEIDSLQFQHDLGAKLGRFDGLAGTRLPEEDSLIISQTENLPNSMPVDLTEKLAALNSTFNDERSVLGGQGPLFLRGPFKVREQDISYQNIHRHSAQLHPPQLNHVGPSFHHPLGPHPSNVNSQMKFVPTESGIHHDLPNHQFLPNMTPPPFHHPSTGMPAFDPSAQHHPMLQQQMRMAGNFPPPHHVMRGYPRGGPVAPPHSNQSGFIQELNQMQGLSLGQRQPSFEHAGIPPQDFAVADSGSNHPEAFRRLIERELRSTSQQYGHELDMGFGHR